MELLPAPAGTIAEAGLTVRYTTTSTLVNELAEADTARRLSSMIARYGNVDLLCLAVTLTRHNGVGAAATAVPTCFRRADDHRRTACQETPGTGPGHTGSAVRMRRWRE
ncbi:ATP-binding protein [Streptomyces sp. NBC_00012]|uniref:hypothetical protein n=1 Tax=unclassified Streptomyces TaxID=2593676 RepID=UPI00324F6E45